MIFPRSKGRELNNLAKNYSVATNRLVQEASLSFYHARMAAQELKLETPPFDARFPNVNQTRNCWQNYVDYHKCLKVKGEDYAPCQYFKRVYSSLCPVAWVSLSN